MTDHKETNSTSKEDFAGKSLNSCCGNSEKMSRMREFCSGEDKTLGGRAMMQMMQKMCCAAPDKPGRQKSSDS